MKRRAFTMVELLVVVGVIALLIAMLMPALRRARQQAQAVQCASNLRQVHSAFAMYANEFKGHFPFPMYYQDFLGERLGPVAYNDPITGLPHWRVLECPAEEPRMVYDWESQPAYNQYYLTMSDHPRVRTAFNINWSVGGYAYYHGYGTASTRNGFYGPTINKGGVAGAHFLMDGHLQGHGWHIPYFEWNIDYAINAYWDTGVTYSHAFRHPNYTANMLYLDGHVAPIQSRKHEIGRAHV